MFTIVHVFIFSIYLCAKLHVCKLPCNHANMFSKIIKEQKESITVLIYINLYYPFNSLISRHLTISSLHSNRRIDIKITKS